ncbi:MAG: choline ABC transporter ATP-binding protein [Salaquimonas sp.]
MVKKSKKNPIVKFDNVSIVFGNNPKAALSLIDEGKTRSEIQEVTGQILGVADCSLEIEEGEVLVLMGLSGSGKSTLLRAVNGLNPVVRGQVEVKCPTIEGWRNPHVCSSSELRELRLDWVSMVFQQFGLLPWRTVEENVGLGLELAGRDKKQIKEKVAEQLELVGLSDWSGKQVRELSGGMQQRVGLARAFATDAPILLMDEPYSALDPLIRARLQDELIDLQKRLKRTIIFVSHDLDEAIKIGTRIAIMEGGRIIQCGTAQEILSNPANQYVADFVAHMNPLAVLKAEDAMQPLARRRKGEAKAKTVSPDASLSAIMDLQLATELPVYVEAGSKILGIVEASDIHRALLNKAQGADLK